VLRGSTTHEVAEAFDGTVNGLIRVLHRSTPCDEVLGGRVAGHTLAQQV